VKGINLAQLLEARLFVGRLGDSDALGWWRTDGVLGQDGAFIGPRVLPKTHPTARTRIVFAVAAHACGERHPDPQAQHLFRLDPATEDQLDALLVERLGDHEYWQKVMFRLEAIRSDARPGTVLLEANIVTEGDLKTVGKIGLGPAGRSLPIKNGTRTDETIRLLAAGFTRSEPKSLVVPYLEKP
jgi:hypothetical protein